MEQKTLTLEEANIALEKIQPFLEKSFEINRLLRAATSDMSIMEEIWGERVRQPANPDNRLYQKKAAFIKEKSRELEENMEKIGQAGAIVKDLNQGLVDFYHERDGELVFLCWKQGEDRIRHWHTIGGGYSGRRPLDEVSIRTK